MIRTLISAPLALLLFINGALPAAAGLVIGTFGPSRVTTADLVTGDYTHTMLAAIAADYPGTTYVQFPTITPAALSGVDILIISTGKTGSVPITPLSASEQTAMLNFVKGGGRAMLIAEAYSPFVPAAQSFVSPFGVTVVDDAKGGILPASVTAPTSPVINGPFGVVPGIVVYGSGIFTNLGPYATGLASEDATGKPVAAAIEAGAISPASGRVLMFADSTAFIDESQSGFVNYHLELVHNSLAYLATVPEPSTLVLAAGGAIACLLFRFRRAR